MSFDGNPHTIEPSWPRPPEPQYTSQAEFEYKRVQWLNKITMDDILEEMYDAGVQETFSQDYRIGNFELIGELMIKVKEVYATRLTFNEVFGELSGAPDVDAECAKFLAQWCLEKQMGRLS